MKQNNIDHNNSTATNTTTTTTTTDTDPQTSSAHMCEVLAMVAMGAHYDDNVPEPVRRACFEHARFGLDDALEELEASNNDDDPTTTTTTTTAASTTANTTTNTAKESAHRRGRGDSGALLRVLRLLAMLAMYQILEKRASCWRYIGTL